MPRTRKESRSARGNGSIYYRKKDGLWVASLSYKDAEGLRRRVVGYGKSSDAAVQKLNEIRNRPDVRAKLPKSKNSLGQFFDTWLEAVVKVECRSSTLATYSTIYGKHIETHPIARKPLSEVTHDDVKALATSLTNNGVTPRTRRAVHDLLSSVFKYALDRDKPLITTNPMRGISRPSYDAPKTKALSPKQIDAFLKAAKDDPLEALYVTTIFTGLRSGEVLALTWGDVDLKAGVLTVRSSLRDTGLTGKGTPKREAGDPKSESSMRPVVLPKMALAALKRHRQKHKKATERDLVFPNERGGYLWRQNVLKRSFYPLLERAGLYHAGKPLLTFHGLRHVHGTELFRAGVHPKVVQERLGHSKIGITLDVYSSSIPSLQKAAVDALDRRRTR